MKARPGYVRVVSIFLPSSRFGSGWSRGSIYASGSRGCKALASHSIDTEAALTEHYLLCLDLDHFVLLLNTNVTVTLP